MHVRVMCLCHACTVVHVVPFRAWGQRVSESLGRGRPRAAPQPSGVDTSPPRGDHIHQHTTSLSSTDLPGGRSTEDPGAPLLSAVYVSPSSQQPPGSGAAKIRKTLRLPARMEKTTGGKCPKLHSANLSTWRAPSQPGKCRKNG